MKHPLRVALYFIFLSLVWGSAFVGIEVLVKQLPPWFAASLRTGIASIALFVITKFRAQQPSRILLKDRIRIWSAGLIAIGLPFSFLFWGERNVSAGLAGIINGTVPIWTTLLILVGSTRTKRNVGRKMMAGVFVGFLGLVVIFYPRLAIPSQHTEVAGALAVVFMAICYALGYVLNQQVLQEVKGISIEKATFEQHLASFVYLAALSAVTEHWPSFQDIFTNPQIILTATYLGVFPSAIAFIIYLYLIKEIGAVPSAAVTYCIPVVALVLDMILLGHQPELTSLTGVVLILTGLFFIRSERPLQSR